MTSPGTSSRAAGVIHFPSRFTRALIASLAFSAAMALPAWCSSQNPTTALARSRTQDDAEVRPMPGYRRQDHRRFDHPRDRTPEIGEEFQELDWFSFLRSRWAHIGSAVSAPRLDVRPSGDDPNFFSTFGKGRDFRSSFALGFDPGLESAALVSGVVRCHSGRSFCLRYAPRFRDLRDTCRHGRALSGVPVIQSFAAGNSAYLNSRTSP